MSRISIEKPHYKFLKKPTSADLNVGDFISNVVVDKAQDVYLYDLIINRHLILTFFDTECSSCEEAMNNIKSFATKNPHINIVSFIHTTDDVFQLLDEYYNNSPRVYRLAKEIINEELKIYSFPKGITINEIGQVLHIEILGPEYVYDFLKIPLRKLLPNN